MPSKIALKMIMGFLAKLIPRDTNIDFMSIRYFTYMVSLFLVGVSLISILYKEFNYGIDFAGGINIEIRTEKQVDITQMRQILKNLDIGEVVIQNFSKHNDISIKVGGVNSEENLMANIELIKQALEQNFATNIDYRKVDFVGPQVGSQMIKLGISAMSLSFLAIMLYVWARFEWQFGIGVIIALLHDVLIGLGMMSIMQYDFNLSTIAAILTIIGYSVNNSVVIYDRIRENLRKFSLKTMDEIINKSINDTMSRTTITAFTTLLANFALIMFGGEAIKSFSILVFFGIFIGTYSSIFLASPILTLFNARQ